MALPTFVIASEGDTTHSDDPSRYCLPAGYRQQLVARTRDDWDRTTSYWTPERIASSRRYQFHVYRWAAAVVKSRGLRSVLDVGSGPAVKLRDMIAPVCNDITAVDQPSALTVAAAMKIPATLSPIDLERPRPPTRRFDLVICADVIEHLVDPREFLRYLARAASPSGYVLISTPERDRLRGRGCLACDKPDHVREWGRDEFIRYLGLHGFEVLRSRLMPQDDSLVAAHRDAERQFRGGSAPRSPLSCHAVLCRARATLWLAT